MNIDLVITQLKSLATMFSGNVAGAAQYEKSVDTQTWLPFPAAYVVPLEIEAEAVQNLTGYNQVILEKIGVIVVLDNSADRRGQTAIATIDQVQKAIFSSILNWRPDSSADNPTQPSGNPQLDYEARGFMFDGAYLRGWDRSRLFFQFDFALPAQLSSTDCWQPASTAFTTIMGSATTPGTVILEAQVTLEQS